MPFVSDRQPVVTIRFHSSWTFGFNKLQYVTIRYISYKLANYRKDSLLYYIVTQISRSLFDNLRHQTLVDERNANA